MKNLINRARLAWESARNLRARRLRHKNYTYGRQWGDNITTNNGQTMTELQLLRRLGHNPTTYNLLRPLVNTVTGHFRRDIAPDRQRPLLADDTRTLEEFLISGCAIQRLSAERRPDGDGPWADMVSPARFFISDLTDSRGDSAEMVGQIHDMTLARVLMKFSHGDRRRAQRLRQLFDMHASAPDSADAPSPQGRSVNDALDFDTPRPGTLRVIEVWTLECGESPRQSRRWSLRPLWHCRYLLPMGDILDHYTAPRHPYVMSFYPMIDGEIHPFVEDIIDHQRHVNRLLTLHDRFIATAAKGVLLFPDNQCSPSMPIDSAMANWKTPDGVVIYTAKPGLPGPQQVSTSAGSLGVEGVIDTHLRLLQESSGVGGALRGQDTAGNISASLYHDRREGASTALADLTATFTEFLDRRDTRLATL